MLNRVFNTLKHLNHRTHGGSGFDSYLANIQRYSMGGGPSVEEARKDLMNTVHNETHAMLG